jgi:hypothetical protein
MRYLSFGCPYADDTAYPQNINIPRREAAGNSAMDFPRPSGGDVFIGQGV